MSVISFEGVIENGQIHLPPDIQLPEKGRVYIVVPDPQESLQTSSQFAANSIKHIYSPRLHSRWQAGDFRMEIREANA